MLGLERAVRADADIVGLLLAQLAQLHPDPIKMQPRDLLIEMLGRTKTSFL